MRRLVDPVFLVVSTFKLQLHYHAKQHIGPLSHFKWASCFEKIEGKKTRDVQRKNRVVLSKNTKVLITE